MPVLPRFTGIAPGAITFIGNTLGLSKDTNNNLPGTRNAIGAFITTNTALPVPAGWGGVVNLGNNENVTLNWPENSSSAILNIPSGSVVLYAELIWGGSARVLGEDVTASINNSINLTTPQGTFSITPSIDTTTGIFNFIVDPTRLFYLRSANVTSYILTGGSGTYTVGEVPSTIIGSDNTNNHAGWTLAVVYENLSLPMRSLYLGVGGELISTLSPPLDITVTGFVTPPLGPVNGRVLLSAQEGDAVFVNDQALFGPDTLSLTALSGLNNPVDNFFASQINIADPNNPSVGQIDTSGSFGNNNHDAFAGTDVFAGRQGWDITSVDATPALVNGQLSAVLRLTTQGDIYLTNGIGIQVDVAAPNIEPTKFVDKAFAEIGDTLTYTVVIPNNGPEDALNVTVIDILPVGTTFVSGSFEVDGSPVPGADPLLGVNIGTITSGGSKTVTFEATVDFQLLPVTLINLATINYEYVPSPGLPPIPGVALTNEVTTQVNDVQLTLVKTVDKPFVQVGDTLTYTLVATNIGTIPFTNVNFQDFDPPGTSFVPDSVFIDFIAQPGLDPNVGFPLADLLPLAFTTVSFSVTVNSVPVPNPTTDIASLTYDFQVDPSQPVETRTQDSNPVDSLVVLGELTADKSVDKEYADVGDTLTYTIVVANSGNVAATNVVLTDPIPNGTSFVTGSVTIDSISQPAADPALGIALGTMLLAETRTVRFLVTIGQIPVPNPIPDTAVVDYQYLIDPQGPLVSKSTPSNTVETLVSNVDLLAEKSVDKEYADIGDFLTYTITLTNNGNTSADNVVVTDLIPDGTSFVPDSVVIDTIPQPGANPSTGINIGSIASGITTVIIFEVIVEAISLVNPIPDSASIDYEYTVDPQQPPVSVSITTNTVTTQINHAEVVAEKAVDKSIAEVGDVLTYTITLENTGNVPANVILVTDPIPNGTIFVPNSVTINGIPQPGVDPALGINIAGIPAGATYVVSFQTTIVSLPVPNPIPNSATVAYQYTVDPLLPPIVVTTTTNIVTTQAEIAELTLFKSADKAIAAVGETITYSVVISNTGTVPADNIIFTDPPPTGISFIVDSLTIDGIVQPGADPTAGVNISSLSPGGFRTITFDVTVSSVPSPNPTINTASATFQFLIDPAGPLLTRTAVSNPVPVLIVSAFLQLIKAVDKEVSNVGDILTYTFVIRNTGTVTVNNVIFSDQPPPGTSFIPDSFAIDSIIQPGENPSLGVSLGSIDPEDTVNVSFRVSVDFIPCPPELINTATVDFDYIVESGRPPLTGSSTSNPAETDVGLRIFKQLSVQEVLEIPVMKPDIEEILDIAVKFEIILTKVKPTPIGESYEGQVLTGWKLIVEGKLKQIVEYIAAKPSQPIHAAHFEVPFSTFLILPEDYNQEPLKVKGSIEDVFYTLQDNRTIFKNVTLLVEGFI